MIYINDYELYITKTNIYLDMNTPNFLSFRLCRFDCLYSFKFQYATIDYLYAIEISRVPCPVSRRVMYPGVTLVQSQVYVTWSTLLTLIGT